MLPCLFTALLLVRVGTASEVQTLTYAETLRQVLANNPTLVSAEASLSAASGGLVSARGAFDPTWSADAGRSFAKSEYVTASMEGSDKNISFDWGTSLSSFMPTGTSLSLEWRNTYNYQYSWYNWTVGDFSLSDESETATYASSLTASITQSLLQGFKTAYNLQAVRQAARGVSQAQAELDKARLQAVADAAVAYWNLDYQQSLLNIAREALAVAQEEHRVVEAMLASGRAAPVEITRVDAAVVQARTDLLEAEASLRQASDTLAVLMGQRPGVLIQAASEPTAPLPTALDPNRVTEAALAQNPDMVLARLNLENAEEDLRAARHAMLPELTANAYYSLQGYDQNADMANAMAGIFNGKLPMWYLGAELSLPLGNRVDRGTRTQSMAELTQARQSLTLTEQTVIQETRTQLRNLELGLQKIHLAEAQLELAKTTMNAEKALQREGRAIQKDVLEAQESVSSAQAELARARTDYAVALVELGRQLGRMEEISK